MVTKQIQSKKRGHQNRDLGLRFDERQSAPFEADILVSAEYGRVHQRLLVSPERRLMLAILEESIADFQKYISARDSKGKQRFAEAETWILDQDSNWTFSFVHICEVLGFDPNYLRQGLGDWKQKKLTQKSSAPMGSRRKPPKGTLLSAA